MAQHQLLLCAPVRISRSRKKQCVICSSLTKSESYIANTCLGGGFDETWTVAAVVARETVRKTGKKNRECGVSQNNNKEIVNPIINIILTLYEQ